MSIWPGRRSDRSPEQAIVVDWQRLADGRARRVTRGVDFSGSAASFRQAATNAAAEMGKQVLLTRDRLEPRTCVWIQFADAELVEGSPCRCGGARIRRIGMNLGRCRDCGATLILKERREEEVVPAETVPEPDTPPVERDAASLDDFSEIRLVRFREHRAARDYAGLGVDSDGRTVLLVVRIPLQGGEPVSQPDSTLGVVHEVVLAKPEPSVHLRSPAELAEDEAQWDIVLL